MATTSAIVSATVTMPAIAATASPSAIVPGSLPNQPNSQNQSSPSFTSFNSLSVYAFLGLIIVTLLATFQYFRFKRMRALYAANDSEAGEYRQGRRRDDADTASIQTLPAYFSEKLPEYSETEEQNNGTAVASPAPSSPSSTTTVDATAPLETGHHLDSQPPTYEPDTPTSPPPNEITREEDRGLSLALALLKHARLHRLIKPESIELLQVTSPTGSSTSRKDELEVVKQVRNAATKRQQMDSPTIEDSEPHFVIIDNDADLDNDNDEEERGPLASSSALPIVYPSSSKLRTSTSSIPSQPRNSRELPSVAPPSESQPDEITIDVSDPKDTDRAE